MSNPIESGFVDVKIRFAIIDGKGSAELVQHIQGEIEHLIQNISCGEGTLTPDDYDGSLRLEHVDAGLVSPAG
jgi:hypothetical protein